MQKLIGLLNEYEAKRHKTNVIPQIRKGEDRLSYLEMNWSYSELLCISKRYGFIKWLVDNDKIDRNKVLEEIGSCIKISGLGPHYSFYSALLMILAVSDTPIDDLISYLK